MIELLQADRRDAAVETMAAAFWNDPVIVAAAPHESKRATACPWIFAKMVEIGRRWGQVACSADTSGVAIWFPPGNTHISLGKC